MKSARQGIGLVQSLDKFSSITVNRALTHWSVGPSVRPLWHIVRKNEGVKVPKYISKHGALHGAH